MTWRTTSLLLGALLLWQTWRGCTRPAPRAAPPCERAAASPGPSGAARGAARAGGDPARPGGEPAAPAPPPPAGTGFNVYGFRVEVPGWAWSLLPQSGEHLRAYRDRMLPLVRTALGPHRERVAGSRDDLAHKLGLDARQRAELDAAARDAAEAIEARLFGAALGGELAPSSFKPMTGVSLARDVLELVDGANKRFASALTEDQRQRLADHPFDFADYLLFATPWEDALRGL
jgi:hypothetical protein